MELDIIAVLLCPKLPLYVLLLCFFLLLHRRRRRTSAAPLINWPLLGMLPSVAANLHRFHDWSIVILQSSGLSVLFHGPWLSHMHILMTCDPANVHHIFNANFSNYPKGRQFSEMFDILGDGIFNADHDSWRVQRHLAQIHMAHPLFRAFVRSCSRDKVDNFLLPLLRQAAEQGKAVDLQDVFLRFSFDVTCKLVFGIDSAALSLDFPAVPFSAAMDEAMAAIWQRHVVPGSWWRLMRRLNLGWEKRLRQSWRVIDDFIEESIQKKKNEARDCANDGSLLALYIKDDAFTAAGEKGDKFLRDTTLNLMLAGRDTVGVALAWFFYLLCANPDEQDKIFDEVNQGEEHVYLKAGLCEALRLYPPVPFEAKGVMEPETLPCGERVEPGMQIFFSAYAMARMEWIWGKDCSEFRPSRWITEKGRVRYEPGYKFVSFNCGPRTCLGKEMAFVILQEAAAAVVREFRLEIVEGHVVVPKLSIILQMRNGLKVRAVKRDKKLYEL